MSKLSKMKYFIVFFLLLSCTDQKEKADLNENIILSTKNIFIDQTVEGETRSRKVIIHANENTKEDFLYPLVFFFHGNGGSAESWVIQNQDFINNHQFIGIYPQGYKKSWNLGAEASNADDIEFCNRIMDELMNYKNVNYNKIFAIGTSNGSAIVNELAIKVDFLRGIAPIASQLTMKQEIGDSQSYLSAYQVCGSDDQVIPYQGGISSVGHNFRSADESALMWAEALECNLSFQIEKVDGDTLFTYTSCKENNLVISRKVEGGNHNLNGKGRKIIRDVWEFFSNI